MSIPSGMTYGERLEGRSAMKLRLPFPVKRLDRWELGRGLFPQSHEVFQVGAHLQARPARAGVRRRCHRPERSGLPSAAWGAGAVRVRLPVPGARYSRSGIDPLAEAETRPITAARQTPGHHALVA